MFPVTLKLESIDVRPVDVVMYESRRTFCASTYGTFWAVKPDMVKLLPMTAFASVTKPVVSFVNWITFVVELPILATDSSVVTKPVSLLPSPSK